MQTWPRNSCGNLELAIELSNLNLGRWCIAGAPILLLISLYGLQGLLSERAHRADVLARGVDANAHVTKSLGPSAVEVRWTDVNGRERSDTSWVGKPFAREGVGKVVKSRHLTDAIERVILSEASERERVNSLWISSYLGFAGVTEFIRIAIGGIAVSSLLSERQR